MQPHFGTPGVRSRYGYSPGDDFYEMLIAAHQGLSDEASELLNARLVLLLANHVGDLRVLKEALDLARQGVGAGGDGGVGSGAEGQHAGS
ncbi:MAG: DUF2783 domain-containing protein [Rubrivivax sp.]|nr:DUF2783 domain-containing protein [Rubrivivax sp.]